MRGFPILNLLIVLAFFGLVWWPLQVVTKEGGRGAEPPGELADSDAEESGDFILKIMTSHPLKSLKVMSLGVPVFTADEFKGELDESLELEMILKDIEIPSEGIEFWLDAVFVKAAGDSQRAVISLELGPDDMERATKSVALWGDFGESKIEGPVFFTWSGGED